MLLNCSPETYEDCLNEVFTLPGSADSEVVKLTLTQVKRRIDNEEQLNFSVLFFCEQASALPQKLYPLTHPRLGEITLFLVPIQKKKSGILYEAAFNLLRGEDQ